MCQEDVGILIEFFRSDPTGNELELIIEPL